MASNKLKKKTDFERMMEKASGEARQEGSPAVWDEKEQQMHTRWREHCSELGKGVEPDSEAAEYLRRVERHRFSSDEQVFQERGIDYTLIQGGFIIYHNRRKYWYWPGSRKWRAEGNSTIYRCYDANQLLNKYILKTG